MEKFVGEMISGFELAKRRDEKKALAMIIAGQAFDLFSTIQETDPVEFVTKNHPLGIEIMRHTASHIMAQAIKELWPNSQIAIGPVIENGFYYDISCDHQITPDDFPLIETKMKEIIKADYKIRREVVSKSAAIDLFAKKNERFKVELIQDLASEDVSLYWHDDKFVDLCRGPHLPKTGNASTHFKIVKIAGAYWRGDSKREMLQRIYAISWFSKEDLETYLHNLEEAVKRDHRKIAKEMDLFHMQEESPGCVFWHPNGWILYNLLKDYIKKRIHEDGYVEVSTPQMIDRSLWEASGHWEKYRENMFIAESEGRILAIKPMNCPGAIQIFKQGTKSYRDLPLRMAEFGCCHRNEPSGALHGVMRVRGFTQDDAHIFCTPEQIGSETKKFCFLLERIYKDLGFENYSVKFSDRPEKRTGTDEIWDISEKLLKNAAEEAGLLYSLNKGEGAFYGPKLEFILKDKIGREWQCGTLQVDFQLPEKLGAWYTGEDGQKHSPIMLHRAVLGSLERFIGIMLEHYAGKLPLWLSPIQVVFATITNEFDNYASQISRVFATNGIRIETDFRAEKISYKIREHIIRKVPIIAIIGAKEVEQNQLTLRFIDGNQETLIINAAIERIKSICTILH
ncbi:MAG: threonine--tRNA ligase [Holosporaceae bacterium]|jgi:threonyl-tRNA synthetase|nr:threonine--tRNA ligase [Holosporaceae bacterium]